MNHTRLPFVYWVSPDSFGSGNGAAARTAGGQSGGVVVETFIYLEPTCVLRGKRRFGSQGSGFNQVVLPEEPSDSIVGLLGFKMNDHERMGARARDEMDQLGCMASIRHVHIGSFWPHQHRSSAPVDSWIFLGYLPHWPQSGTP